MLDGFCRSPAAPSHLGDAGRSRLEEDDPEALLFEAGEACPAEHAEDVAGSVQAGQEALLDPSEQDGRGARPLDERLEAGVLAARSSDRQDHVGLLLG